MDEHEIELRRLRLEARRQLEEAEEAALELANSSRTLRDALLDEGRQGHVVKVEVGGSKMVGRIEHVGQQVIRINSIDGVRTTIVIDAIVGVRVVRAPSHAVLVSVGYPATVEARLREWVQVQAEIVVARRHIDGLVRGPLRAVTPTHLEIADGNDVAWLIPLQSVAWVRRP